MSDILTSLEGQGSSDPLALKDVWEIYIKLVKSQDRSADTVKKQNATLDVLLQLCAGEMEAAKTVPIFSDMKSVCNQLCKEFMSDIVRITSSALDDEEEDVSQLHNYLLEGRGWILLQVIHRSGVQNVSGGRDLANLLVSLLPWCLKFPMQPPGVTDEDGLPRTQFPSIVQCFQQVLKSVRGKRTRQKNRAVPLSRQGNRSEMHDENRQSQSEGHSSSQRKFTHKRKADGHKDMDAEDGDSSDAREGKTKGKTRRKPKLHRVYHSTDIHSQQKADSDSEEDDIYVLLGKFHREPRKSSALELCQLMLELLMDLCNSDNAQTSSVKHLSPSMLPHLLQALLITENIVTDSRGHGQSYLSSSSEETERLKSSELVCRITIQRCLLRVIFTACGIVAAQQNGVNILIGHKIVSHILSIGQRSSIFQLPFESKLLFNRTKLLEMGLVSDVVIGLLFCFDLVFHHLPFNPIFIQSAVSLIEEFDQMQGFQLLRKHILFVDWLKYESPDQAISFDWLEEEPVKVFGSFLNTMKIVRVNYMHSMKCVKRKHQKCEYTQYFDHHHDILGVAAGEELQQKEEGSLLMTRQERTGSQSSFNSQPASKTVCLISSCTDLLLDMLPKVVSKVVRIEVLRTIYTSGVCCCMKMEKIVVAVVKSVGKFSPAVRSFALDALNKIVLEHFAGGVFYEKSISHLYTCTHCDIGSSVSKIKTSVCPDVMAEHTGLVSADAKGLDSGFSSSDRESKFFPLYKLSKWRALHQIKCLLYSENECLAISLAKHLLVLAVKGNPFLKAELFFSIYYDTLGTSEMASQTKNKPVLSKSVQVHCLSALPYLLQSNCVTKAFLTKNGVLKMLELLEDETLRAPVLKIFEALVVLDEQKLDKVDKIQEKECPCPYRGGLVIGSFIEELSKRSFSSDSDNFANSFDYEDEEDFIPRGRVRQDSVVLAQWTLPVLVDLWDTCAKLCVHSQAFVTIFRDLQCFRKTEGLLLETLQILLSMYPMKREDVDTEMEDSGLEDVIHCHSSGFFMRISLLESLIVVCGACETAETGRKQRTWWRVKQLMKDSKGLESSKLKVLFDAVLNAAMPQYLSILEYSYSRNIALVYMRDDDVYDEDEVRQLLLTGSESEVEHLTTELGYDADSEDTYFEEDRQLKFRNLLTKIPKKVYFPAVFRLLVELLITVKQTDTGALVISPVLHKLLQTVRVDYSVVKAMCEENLLEVILSDTGFWEHLMRKEQSGAVQEALLALTQELAQTKLWSHDFRKLLQLFNHSDIPMEKLLSVLLTVVDNSRVKPRYSLTFPVLAVERMWGEGEQVKSQVSGIVGPVPKNVSSLVLLGPASVDDIDGHFDQSSDCINIQEVWETCAVQVTLKDSLIWPPYQNGLSLALWVQVEKGQGHNVGPMTETEKSILNIEGDIDTQEQENKMAGKQMSYNITQCLHLVSMGTREKLLEIWVDPVNSCLIFRLTSEISEMGLVVRETELKGIFSPGRWQHIVISYVESLDGSTTTGKILVVIDGCQCHDFILDYPFSAVQPRHKSAPLSPHLCIGHVVPTPHSTLGGTLALGSLMLFKGDLLRKEKGLADTVKKETCFHLYSLGPNCPTISKSDCGEEMFSYAPHLNKQVVVSSRIQYDFLVGLKKVDLTELRSSLLLSYNAKTPRQVSLYNSASSQLSPNLGLTSDSHLLVQQPRQTTPAIQGLLLADVNTGLEMAIDECGGAAVVLFLVAKIYEGCDDSKNNMEAEKLQATALQVLFSMVHHSSKMEQEYINIGGHSLLAKVLTSTHSVIGHHILKVLMDASTSESLFRINNDTGKLVLRQKSEAVIRDASVIEHLILNWQIWEGSDVELFSLLFSGLANLVREDHRHQTFNIKQYEVINLVNKIFKIYQERIQEGYPSLPVSVSQDAIAIVQNMIGSPPDYQMIMYMCDFLLMVHPAANTYINHSRSGFYFSLMWGLPASPLTKWKQEQKWPILAASTPVKDSVGRDTAVSQGKKNLNKVFEEESEGSDYPSIEVTKETKPRAYSDPAQLTGARSQQNDFNASRKILSQKRHNSERLETHSDPQTMRDKGLDVDQLDGVLPASPSSGAGSSPADDKGSPILSSADMTVSESRRIGSMEMADLEENVEFAETAVDVEKSVNMSDMKDKMSLRFDEENMEIVKLEEGLTALCVGLLRLLSDIIMTMPDALTEKTFQKSINPRILIVLAHNSSPEIREAVIKVITSYLVRSNQQHMESFLRMEGFQLLSAQLLQYPTHQEQVEAAISLVLQRPFRMEDGIQDCDSLEEVTQVQQSAVSVVLALLGNTTGDLALCHNSLELCLALFDVSNVLATVMVDQGLVEVLCNMTMKLLEDFRSTDVEGVDENEILLRDLQQFFGTVAVREFSASYPEHYQHFEDIITLLKEMEGRKDETHGMKSKSVQTLRIFRHHILLRVLKVVEDASEEVSQQSFSLFTTKPTVNKPTSPIYDAAAYRSSSKPLKSHSPPVSVPRSTRASHPHPPAPQHFSLSGSFAKMTLPLHKKSPAGYYVHSDRLYTEVTGSAHSGSGDSDSSADSLQTSIQTVNLPVVSRAYNRAKSIDLSQTRLVRSNSLLQSVLSIGKRKKLATIPISQNELVDRLKKVLTMAIDLTVFASKKAPEGHKVVMLFDSQSHTVSVERDFQRRLFNFTYKAFEATLTQEKGFYKRTKNVIMWGAKDVLRVQLGRLLCHMLSPGQEFDQRVYALSYMIGESRGMEVLKMITPTSDVGQDLGYNLYELMRDGEKWLSSQQVEDGAKFINRLSSLGFAVPSPRKKVNLETQELLVERKRSIDSRHDSQKHTWLRKKQTALNRIFHKYDGLATLLSGHAMEVTQAVTQLQTQERNKFITHIKQTMTDRIQVKKQWQEIVQNLTHERALWYDEKSYPQSWQLNPTEGPCRVRKRLQRGHLGLDARFLKREFQHKIDSEKYDPPLIYLFEDDHQMSDSAALIYQLHKNKKIRYTSTCRAVSPNSESKGELLIGEDSVFFVADEAITDANYTQVLLGNKDQLSMTWPFEDIREIHKRWYELTDIGMEIFLTNGKTCLLAFESFEERNKLYQHLLNLELPNRISSENLFDVLDDWTEGRLTNFEYLTHLNKIAGRSFNDLMQYPVMPFILKDYTSMKLDLQDKTIYRDLFKPVSVQDCKNEEKFTMNYAILSQEYEKFGKEGITGLRVAPYHYGSHYSNSGTVLHYLVRVPPFTKMFLNFQDQSFDIPDRTFHNLNTSWRLSSAESNTDVKELIPEFFFCHEMFTNREGFNFGKRQTNEEVCDVVLPPWCKNNPRMFILIHRQALESDYVTQAINSWVDLVFGHKQQGDAAVRAINVFHPATYFGIDIDSVKNPVDRKAIRTMVRTYGQTPRQLFKIPHPKRNTVQRVETVKHRVLASKTVTGLKWGCYLGSPTMPEPEPVWQQTYQLITASLVPLPSGFVAGISSNSCLLAQYSRVMKSSENRDDVTWAAILTWGHPDGMIRIINEKHKPAVNFIQHSQFEEIMCCVSVPDCRFLFTGGTAGVITIYNTKHNTAKESELQVFGHKKCLYGHTGTITALVVCKPYSILVSASEDNTCIIWDLNRHSYVRSITSHKSGVRVLAVSDTLGDIASVSQEGPGSSLHLHTVNAELVATVSCEDSITCLTYSKAPEGVSINVIAGGLSSGIIRLWSSWDLTPVRDLYSDDLLAKPVVSLAFTHDSRHLFTSHSDGRVILWDSGNTHSQRPKPRFKPYLYPT